MSRASRGRLVSPVSSSDVSGTAGSGWRVVEGWLEAGSDAGGVEGWPLASGEAMIGDVLSLMLYELFHRKTVTEWSYLCLKRVATRKWTSKYWRGSSGLAGSSVCERGPRLPFGSHSKVNAPHHLI